jgi:hypothetical protein
VLRIATNKLLKYATEIHLPDRKCWNILKELQTTFAVVLRENESRVRKKSVLAPARTRTNARLDGRAESDPPTPHSPLVVVTWDSFPRSRFFYLRPERAPRERWSLSWPDVFFSVLRSVVIRSAADDDASSLAWLFALWIFGSQADFLILSVCSDQSGVGQGLMCLLATFLLQLSTLEGIYGNGLFAFECAAKFITRDKFSWYLLRAYSGFFQFGWTIYSIALR